MKLMSFQKCARRNPCKILLSTTKLEKSWSDAEGVWRKNIRWHPWRSMWDVPILICITKIKINQGLGSKLKRARLFPMTQSIVFRTPKNAKRPEMKDIQVEGRKWQVRHRRKRSPLLTSNRSSNRSWKLKKQVSLKILSPFLPTCLISSSTWTTQVQLPTSSLKQLDKNIARLELSLSLEEAGLVSATMKKSPRSYSLRLFLAVLRLPSLQISRKALTKRSMTTRQKSLSFLLSLNLALTTFTLSGLPHTCITLTSLPSSFCPVLN